MAQLHAVTPTATRSAPRSHPNRGAAGPTRSAGSPDSGGHRSDVSIVRRVTQVLLVVIGLLLIELPLLALAADRVLPPPRRRPPPAPDTRENLIRRSTSPGRTPSKWRTPSARTAVAPFAANQARVSPRLLVWDRPGMRFGSWQAQTALVIMVIALALALSVADSGWRWSLLVPAAVVAITSVVTWRRRR